MMQCCLHHQLSLMYTTKAIPKGVWGLGHISLCRDYFRDFCTSLLSKGILIHSLSSGGKLTLNYLQDPHIKHAFKSESRFKNMTEAHFKKV